MACPTRAEPAGDRADDARAVDRRREPLVTGRREPQKEQDAEESRQDPRDHDEALVQSPGGNEPEGDRNSGQHEQDLRAKLRHRRERHGGNGVLDRHAPAQERDAHQFSADAAATD
jgi:hypothetical protein